MLKKTSLSILTAGAVFALATPAMADPPHWAPAHGFRAKQNVVVHRYVQPVVTRRVVVHHQQPVVRRVVEHRYYQPPVTRTVVVHRPAPVYAAPAPVYAAPAPVFNPLGTIGGAIVGAVIGSHVGGELATGVGAVVGGVVGGSL